MPYNYAVIIMRPDSGQKQTYRQKADSILHAIRLTREEYRKINNQILPEENIVMAMALGQH